MQLRSGRVTSGPEQRSQTELAPEKHLEPAHEPGLDAMEIDDVNSETDSDFWESNWLNGPGIIPLAELERNFSAAAFGEDYMSDDDARRPLQWKSTPISTSPTGLMVRGLSPYPRSSNSSRPGFWTKMSHNRAGRDRATA